MIYKSTFEALNVNLNRGERRVLVADDEEIIADTLEIILANNGFEAAAAYSGKAAIEKARDWGPHILLCDVLLPDINGVEVAIEVSSFLPECKVLLTSGQAGVRDLLQEARHRGHDFEILDKPIHPSELLEHLRSLS